MEFSCALDVADEGGLTHEAVGRTMNVTRERVRQIEASALVRVRRRMDAPGESYLRYGSSNWQSTRPVSDRLWVRVPYVAPK